MKVSVIVPVLNEEAAINALVDTFAARASTAGPFELRFVDGGSNDQTVPRISARKEPFVKLTQAKRRGRARQMNAGAREADADVLVFLHADTQLPDQGLQAIRDAVAEGADFGCFRLNIDSSDLRMRWTSLAVSTRSRFLVSASGDQAQFFRRAFFYEVGAYPDVPFLEDLEILKHAKKWGTFRCLDQAVTTSARRWEAEGKNRLMFKMVALRAAYHLGVSPERLAGYYRSNPTTQSARN